MNEQTVITIVNNALVVIMQVSAPMLIAGLVVGIIVSIFQAVTSIQEQTLTFVPKIVAMFCTMLFLGSWMLTVLIEFTTNLLTNFGQYF